MVRAKNTTRRKQSHNHFPSFNTRAAIPRREATGRRHASQCRTETEVPVTRPAPKPSAGRRIQAGSDSKASRASLATAPRPWSRERKPWRPRFVPPRPPTPGPRRRRGSRAARRRSTPCSGSTRKRRSKAAASPGSSTTPRSPWIDTTRRTRTTCRAWRPRTRSPRTSGRGWSAAARRGRSSSARPAPSPTSRTRRGNSAPTSIACALCSRRPRTCCSRRRWPSSWTRCTPVTRRLSCPNVRRRLRDGRKWSGWNDSERPSPRRRRPTRWRSAPGRRSRSRRSSSATWTPYESQPGSRRRGRVRLNRSHRTRRTTSGCSRGTGDDRTRGDGRTRATRTTRRRVRGAGASRPPRRSST